MQYHLLPFNFTRIAGKEILVNELGDMLVVPEGTAHKTVYRQLEKDDLYKSLVANFFISEKPVPDLMDVYASRMAEKLRFLDEFTALHIFVVTLQCNQNCMYCQASSREAGSVHCTMSKETMHRAVQFMYKSNAKHLTMEFQGGEPTLAPDIIRYGIELSEEINKVEQRTVSYVLCTNSVNLTDEMLDLCKQYRVLISTSLDGPEFLHNANRGKEDSYQKVTAGIAKAREVLGHDRVSALLTTSEKALDYPIEIIDEYVKLGFPSVFLRGLNPYGLALKTSDWKGYTVRFIEFYKKALEYILTLNKNGTFFIEEFAAIVLRKALTPFCTGFVDLQSPAGVINSVLVYNYDGGVYASDESRMLAEFDDYTFKLGELTDDYESVVYGEKAQKIMAIGSNAALAGCSDCPLRHYCGADPVRNYSTQGDMYGIRPTSLLCMKNKGLIEYLLSLIATRYDEVMPIFKSWLR